MNSVSQAIQLMLIGLPIMFGVIILFMLLTVALKKIFPYNPENEK